MLLLIGLSLLGSTTRPDLIRGRCVRVLDGDSLEMEGPTGPFTVRLSGVDAPEWDQPWGRAARAWVEELCEGRMLTLDVVDRDRHGRLVARVRSGRIDVSRSLADAGLAWHDERYSRDGQLRDLARSARRAGRGLWSTSKPVAPWDHRARRSADASEVAEKDATTPSVFVANTRSGVFHSASCRNAGCRNCRRHYARRADALAAGHRPAGCCRP
ncbi:MAG: thermonuclease family protein [Acidobacteriota bacterium]